MEYLRDPLTKPGTFSFKGVEFSWDGEKLSYPSGQTTISLESTSEKAGGFFGGYNAYLYVWVDGVSFGGFAYLFQIYSIERPEMTRESKKKLGDAVQLGVDAWKNTLAKTTIDVLDRL
jgi:hypothetical protein